MKKKILLVDNDVDCLEIFEYLLQAEGYDVHAVPSPVLSDNKYDLIILDENLEGMQGSDYCRILKSNSHTSSIPVILTSASDMLNLIARDCKADYFLAKPFDIVELETLVSEILTSKK